MPEQKRKAKTIVRRDSLKGFFRTNPGFKVLRHCLKKVLGKVITYPSQAGYIIDIILCQAHKNTLDFALKLPWFSSILLLNMKDKVVLITGGGRGIGKAAVLRFFKAGFKVAFCARTEGELLSVTKEVGSYEKLSKGEVLSCRVDISSQREVFRMVNQVVSKWGRIDLLINNAGVLGPSSTIATYAHEAWEEVIRINLNGTFFVTQAVIRSMIPRRSGTIISLSSSVGRRGRAGWGAYAVSKFALEGMMQTLAEEVTDFGLRVVTLNPEATRTRMRAKAYTKEDPSTVKDPEKVAEALFDLASSTDSSLQGQSLNFSDLDIIQ